MQVMQIVHWGRVRKFFHNHRQAKLPLLRWKTAVQAANWENFSAVRQTFNSADWVDGKLVFNIKGNDYRLIATAQFSNGRIYVRQVMTHAEYDQAEWTKKGP
ncbi:MAG: type II toxin-antitoxin system HigB family toxin [Cyanobacteria bacterium SZAS LIN-2]|nr:type II toxin-antitoxin system HigB family toxin [Cyanobacteria bacterium SZAS LIN-2]